MSIHQGIQSREVLTSGVVFNVNDVEGGGDGYGGGYDSDSSQSDRESGPAGSNAKYFRNLAKLTAGAGTLTDLCQGSECADDDQLDDDSLPPFQALRGRMNDLVGDGGIMKLVRRQGSGPQIQPGCHALMHYTGQCEAQDEPFDSTYLRGRGNPQSHLIGPKSELIPGLNMAVLSMRKGEESLFLISPQYAYGEMGCAPRIPENSEVLFRVLLVSWTDSREVDEFNEMSEEERLRASFQQRMRAIRCGQTTGNTHYTAGDYRAAAKTYRDAIRIYTDTMVFANATEHSEAKHVIFKVMSNRTQSLLCLNQWKEAAKQGRQALNHSDEENDTSKYILYLRLAKAMIYLPQMSEARRWLAQASKLKPRGRDLRRMMELLETRAERNRLKDVEFARNIFQPQRAKTGSSETEASTESHPKQTADEGESGAAATNLEFDASFVTAEYKNDVEQLLVEFKNKCNVDENGVSELCLPFDGSDEARHKMVHVQSRCVQLGLKFVPATALSGPRVTKA